MVKMTPEEIIKKIQSVTKHRLVIKEVITDPTKLFGVSGYPNYPKPIYEVKIAGIGASSKETWTIKVFSRGKAAFYCKRWGRDTIMCNDSRQHITYIDENDLTRKDTQGMFALDHEFKHDILNSTTWAGHGKFI